MKSDIGFRFEDGSFRLRGCGIIIRDNKVLMVNDEKRGYYYGIGGAVRIGEKTEDAAIREVYEESGLKCEVDRLLFVEENIFEDHNNLHHEIAFYYLMKNIGNQETKGDRVCDNPKEGLVWADIDHLDDHKMFPEAFKTILKKFPQSIQHSIVCDADSQ